MNNILQEYMKFIKPLILILMLFLNSCVSVKNTISNIEVEKLENDNLYSILGTYKNVSKSNEMQSLWTILDYNYEIDNATYKNLTVTLIAENNKIFAELKNENLVLRCKEIKGKVYNGYYLLKNQYKFKTMFVYLINGFGQSAVKISKTENSLITLEKVHGWGLIVIFPGFASGGNLRTNEFERIK